MLRLVRQLPRNHLPSRRTVLAAGSGLLGMHLPALLGSPSPAQPAKAKNIIFLFLFGGPSQLETFDLKPAAPDNIRGPYKPIPCRTPGLRICEHLPRLADISNRYTILRTLGHSWNDHSGGAHYLQTGKRWHVPIGGGFNPTQHDWPSIGSVLDYTQSRQAGGNLDELGRYFVLPNSLGRLQEGGQYRRPGEHAGWLGRTHNPLTTAVDKKDTNDNPYWRNCSDGELTFQIDGLQSPEGNNFDRVRGRTGLLEKFDTARKVADEQLARDMDTFQSKALALLTSGHTRDALNIQAEDVRLRDRYGRHLFGQSCLMARRLVEAGARYVTVHYDCVDGYSWDSHRNTADVHKHLLPTFDQGASALIADLFDRGLLDDTLVVALGEMGRTPKANAEWGRDHWSFLFPGLFAGGGVAQGGLLGASNKDASHAVDLPCSPEDLAATLYHALGMDAEMRLNDYLGREVSAIDNGRIIRELFV